MSLLPAETKVVNPIENVKGNTIEREIEQKIPKKERIVAEMFKGGKRPHIILWNRISLNIKLKQNPELAKEVINADNTPQKDLIINREDSTSSNRPKKTKSQGKSCYRGPKD